MGDVINWRDGTKIWLVVHPWGSMTLCETKESALDQLTRKDELWSFVVSKLKKERV
jgi:hypothetical protein